MTVFEFDISPKDSSGVISVDYFNEAIWKAVATRMKTENITKTEISKRLDCNKSTITRLLKGNQNITARTFGELLWALDFEFDIVLHDLLKDPGNSTSVHHIFTECKNSKDQSFFRSQEEKSLSGTNKGTEYRYNASGKFVVKQVLELSEG